MNGQIFNEKYLQNIAMGERYGQCQEKKAKIMVFTANGKNLRERQR